ncbi:NUDIX hydrolase [Aliiroseovarius sp. S1339]|uniref:NUDIX domain-containing protein n=1 Tax=Aliiroseovarius sp. S1339 TaxID=2936990 RepID=UPI0020C10FCE|nr:NUDIX hydrolase [Aliiroseovarius sp. S1339]MCK8464913.1 NUDIX hydrolase [Aliiroseovarius sp. S1339]
MSFNTPRLAVRGLILQENRLLMVNAYGGGISDLLCLPGGGVEPGASLPDNLIREVYEECGLTVSVSTPALVNEFYDPATGFHQVEVIFRCKLDAGQLDPAWQDSESIVTDRRWVAEDQISTLHFRPLSLPELAWGEVHTAPSYDALETIVR